MRNTIKPIQLYRGTTQQHSDYAGPVGEITVDTEKYTVVVQNGATGGVPLAREDTVVSLTSRIAAEESVRATADTALRISITDEVSARKSADIAFQNSIASEASARETADTALQNNIASEASSRATADTLPFTPNCPLCLLRMQADTMRRYLDTLEIRGKIEKINLVD